MSCLRRVAATVGVSMSERIKISQSLSLGGLWFTGWLFSIGFLKLGFFQGLIGLLVWPYFLGAHFAG
jgi:hypothetical protein